MNDETKPAESAKLWNTIKNMPPQPAPTKTMRHGEHYSFLIAIGVDNTAQITMTREAYEVLRAQQEGE